MSGDARDPKDFVEHVEDDHKDEEFIKPIDDSNAPRLAAWEANGLLKSRFDELSIPRTLWTFRRAALYCFMSYIMAMIEDWEVGCVLTVTY